MDPERATEEPPEIVENRELDRQRVEAFNRKDIERLMSFRWNSPDLAACRTFAASPLFSTTALLRVKSYVL